MTTQRQIDDPRQWRVGDTFEGAYQGHPFTGVAWDDSGDLMAGGVTIRFSDGMVGGDVTGHVTRTVEPIPEPTVPWALVRHADGAVRVIEDKGHQVCEHTAPKKVHGPIVAVSLPHWSDEADGLRADGASLIAAERKRQVEVEGYTEKHDAGHAGDLLAAASCYLKPVERGNLSVPFGWPWGYAAWKPTPGNRKRELVKAGALIAAALDVLLAEGGEA